MPLQKRPALPKQVKHLIRMHNRSIQSEPFPTDDDRLAQVAVDLSVVIITKNEARNIAGALESVSWASDVVVIDSGSTDNTVAIARRYTDRVSTREWEGYGAQKRPEEKSSRLHARLPEASYVPETEAQRKAVWWL